MSSSSSGGPTRSSTDGGPGLHSRTLEVLDQRGVADRFVAAGRTHPFVGYAGTSLDISDFPTRHNYVLALWQKDIEVILAGWVDELGVSIRREHEVVGFRQDGRPDVELSRKTRRYRRVRRAMIAEATLARSTSPGLSCT